MTRPWNIERRFDEPCRHPRLETARLIFRWRWLGTQRLLPLAATTLTLPFLTCHLGAAPESWRALTLTIKPAAVGTQLVRSSLPLPRGFLREGDTLVGDDRKKKIELGVRPLSWYQADSSDAKSARRAIVTFPYSFKTAAPVQFTLRPATAKHKKTSRLRVDFALEQEQLVVKHSGGPVVNLRLVAPARNSTAPARRETVESNVYYRWERFFLPDTQWPRVVEVRADALGGIVVIAHLQRNLPKDGRAPDLGWEAEIPFAGKSYLSTGQGNPTTLGSQLVTHSYTNGVPCALYFDNDNYRIYHPAAAQKRRGRSEAEKMENRLLYRYWRCTADERVPMQPASWQRAELVISPATVAPLTAALLSPHKIAPPVGLWDDLYATGQPLDLKDEPELAAALNYHHLAIIRSMAIGDDWGNVTGYGDGQEHGGAFGMNRLNHCPPIFQEAWRSGDRRLLETALLWCDNFYDQSIWWGEKGRGGTRYNNIIARRQTPPDNDQTYMWRSNDAVDFCTKGYDAFWLAYEENGDPRMSEALEAQVNYALDRVHADRGECRNIGDAREFLRLYRYTSEKRYLERSLDLFRELRTKISERDLFDQGGKPLSSEPPFIDDDEAGMHVGYAKPYIIGYALAGLPELATLAPQEPKLRGVVSAVADFLAESQDPLGGWRYPHPRSSYLIMSQGIEHAWQLVQADRFLGPQEKHLDAIERVLRQRILGWQRTQKILNGLGGWEEATGKIKSRAELYQLYKKPDDRDFTRDYREGGAGWGGSSPEGLVYFPDVLAFYLKHRPAARLLAPPRPDEPLALVLGRAPQNKP